MADFEPGWKPKNLAEMLLSGGDDRDTRIDEALDQQPALTSYELRQVAVTLFDMQTVRFIDEILKRRLQEIGRNGGKTRSDRLTPERRQAIARMGGAGRRGFRKTSNGQPEPEFP